MVTVNVDGSVLDRITKIMSYLRLGSSGKVLKKKKKEKDAKGNHCTEEIIWEFWILLCRVDAWLYWFMQFSSKLCLRYLVLSLVISCIFGLIIVCEKHHDGAVLKVIICEDSYS